MINKEEFEKARDNYEAVTGSTPGTETRKEIYLHLMLVKAIEKGAENIVDEVRNQRFGD